MKITILGSGTCASQLPGIPNRYPPGFLAEWENQKVLFECSEGIRFRLEQAGYDYADIHHIAISHSHPDHFAFMHFLQSLYCTGSWGGTRNGILHIYAPQQIASDFDTLWRIHIPDRSQKPFEFSKLHWHVVPSESYAIESGRLSGAKVHHGSGNIDAVAFRLETPQGVFAYSGDSGDCEGLRAMTRNADVFISDATARITDTDAPTGYGHLNPFAAGQIAKDTNVRKLVLTHYIGSDSDSAMIEDCKRSGFTGKIIIAKDFQVIEI
jgi:ribonuclease BN (tRNA processing enzyme)